MIKRCNYYKKYMNCLTEYQLKLRVCFLAATLMKEGEMYKINIFL